jgi:hypothetical protein
MTTDEKEIVKLSDQIHAAMERHLKHGVSVSASVIDVIGDTSPKRQHLMLLMLYNLNWRFIKKWIEEVDLDE